MVAKPAVVVLSRTAVGCWPELRLIESVEPSTGSFPEMVKLGSTVIDVGLTRTNEGLFGDVDPAAAERAAYITPVPGGVGPMTIAMVLQNTVNAARARRGKLANPAH